MRFIWPVPGYYTITSGYHDPRSYGLHGGFDIAAPAVSAIAISIGTVIFVGWAGSAGRSVYVDLENGYRVHYCHLSRIDVRVGQRLAAGDPVGLVGGSGHGADNYYGYHLHLNLFASTQLATGPSHWVAWVGKWAVDPELYLGLGREEDDMPLSNADIIRIREEAVIKPLSDPYHHYLQDELQPILDAIAALALSGGLSKAQMTQVQKIVRQEIDKTKLTA